MQKEPTRLEIILTKIAFLLYGKSIYKGFADRLPLEGYERVLDFGCGMGTVAYYIVKRLNDGTLTCLDISKRWLLACCKTLRNYKNVTFLLAPYTILANETFDIVYCHFVLHDILDEELETVVSTLVKSLKSGGSLQFREPLNQVAKLNRIKHLMNKNQLTLKESRITDIPLLGNALESRYIKP